MSFPFEIKDRLVAQGVGVYGTNLFIGSKAVIPALGSNVEATNGKGPFLTIIETGGSGPSLTHNDTATTHPTAQILTRAVSADDARVMAKAAYDALGGANGLFNIVLSGVAYLSLKARQELTDVGLDQAARMMVSFNIEVEKGPS